MKLSAALLAVERLPHRYVRAPAALISLCRQHLVRPAAAQIHPVILPCIHVVAKSDGNVASGRSLRLPYTPELGEGCCSVNGRGVGSCSCIDIVCASITGHGPFIGSGRSVSTPAIHNVIFDE
ncbi:hypothetical protein D3C80_1517230 [compost metagenome]